MVVVGAEDGAAASIPARVVVDQAQADDAIEIDLIEAEALLLVSHITIAGLITGGQLTTGAKQPVLGKHPIVGIASGDDKIIVLDVADHHATIEMYLVSLTHTIVERSLQIVVIHIERVAGKANACHPRTTTYLLTSALAEGCWVRETPMIEDVISAGARDAHIDTCKGNTLEKAPIDAIAQTYISNLIIVARATIEQVDTHLRRIDADVELLTEAILAEAYVLDIERVAQKEPSPSEVRANLGGSVRRQRDALTIATNDKALVGAGNLTHHSELVVIGLDILIVEAVELAHRATDDAQLAISAYGIDGECIRLGSTCAKPNQNPQEYQQHSTHTPTFRIYLRCDP